MRSPSTVLIVDRSIESRHVLRTLLERQGARAVEAGQEEEARRVVEQDPPDLIVVDWDTDTSHCPISYRGLNAAFGRKNTPILVIGNLKRDRGQLPDHCFISKPYHYRDLLRKIEEMLGNAA